MWTSLRGFLMIREFLLFSPRIIPKKTGTFEFRVQKRSTSHELLLVYQELLVEEGITSKLYKTKSKRTPRGHDFVLQVTGTDNVLKFLDLVGNFRQGEEWKRISARKIRKITRIKKTLGYGG